MVSIVCILASRLSCSGGHYVEGHGDICLTHTCIIYTVELGYDVLKGTNCVVIHECYYHRGV